MLNRKNLQDYLYIDIETIPQYKSFEAMPQSLQKLWLEKHHFRILAKAEETFNKEIQIENFFKDGIGGIYHTEKNLGFNASISELYIKEAGLYPEFSKIFCITFGVFENDFKKTISTICEDDEKAMIEEFLGLLFHFDKLNLFGFNISDFDIPYILKRMWLNGYVNNYPPQLQLGDAKPWTVKHFDLMQAYKSLSWNFISLDLLCESLGIPSPKTEFSNSEFTTLITSGKITKEEGIAYCERDVAAMMDATLKLSSDTSNYFPSKFYSYPKKKATTTV